MKIAFILTMPGNNSWNGKWSGDSKLWCVIRSYRSQAAVDRILSKRTYGYNFGDGWYAQIEVRKVDAAEARALLKESQGFCGYEWMIDPLVEFGKILRDDQIAAHVAAEKAKVANPATVPTLDEALRNPAEFVAGMTEF